MNKNRKGPVIFSTNDNKCQRGSYLTPNQKHRSNFLDCKISDKYAIRIMSKAVGKNELALQYSDLESSCLGGRQVEMHPLLHIWG